MWNKLTSNERKTRELGMPIGTATHRLRKSLMFSFVVQLSLDNCHRCHLKIENEQELSIEHKEDWLGKENAKELFYDLNNIAFSHLKCNVTHSLKKRGRARRQVKPSISGSGYKGVSYEVVRKKFRADVVVNRKTKYIGRFDSASEAAHAYDVEAIKHFGDNALTNHRLGLI